MKEKQPKPVQSIKTAEPLYALTRRDITAMAIEQTLPTKKIGYETTTTSLPHTEILAKRVRKEVTIFQVDLKPKQTISKRPDVDAIEGQDLKHIEQNALVRPRIDTVVQVHNLKQAERDAVAKRLREIRNEIRAPKKRSENAAWASFIKNAVKADGLNSDGSIKADRLSAIFSSDYFDKRPEMRELVRRRLETNTAKVGKKSKLLKEVQKKEEKRAALRANLTVVETPPQPTLPRPVEITRFQKLRVPAVAAAIVGMMAVGSGKAPSMEDVRDVVSSTTHTLRLEGNRIPTVGEFSLYVPPIQPQLEREDIKKPGIIARLFGRK